MLAIDTFPPVLSQTAENNPFKIEKRLFLSQSTPKTGTCDSLREHLPTRLGMLSELIALIVELHGKKA